MLTLYHHGGDWIDDGFYQYIGVFCKYFGIGGGMGAKGRMRRSSIRG